ncbi:MAG: hypothetical protein NVS9B8_01460 [Candidatus Limnocylindrales bacterium]
MDSRRVKHVYPNRVNHEPSRVALSVSTNPDGLGRICGRRLAGAALALRWRLAGAPLEPR